MKYKTWLVTFLRWLTSIVFVFLLFLEIVVIYEFTNVGILGNIDGYPWGWQGADNYASPKVYAISMMKNIIIIFVELVIVGLIWWRFLRKRN